MPIRKPEKPYIYQTLGLGYYYLYFIEKSEFSQTFKVVNFCYSNNQTLESITVFLVAEQMPES